MEAKHVAEHVDPTRHEHAGADRDDDARDLILWLGDACEETEHEHGVAEHAERRARCMTGSRETREHEQADEGHHERDPVQNHRRHLLADVRRRCCDEQVRATRDDRPDHEVPFREGRREREQDGRAQRQRHDDRDQERDAGDEQRRALQRRITQPRDRNAKDRARCRLRHAARHVVEGTRKIVRRRREWIRSLRISRLRSTEALLRLAVTLRLPWRIPLRLTGRRIPSLLLRRLTVRLLRWRTIRLRTIGLRRLAEILLRLEARLTLLTLLTGRRITTLMRRHAVRRLTTGWRIATLLLRRLTVRLLGSGRRRLIRLWGRYGRLCTEALLLRRLKTLRLAVASARVRRAAGPRSACGW